MLKLKIPFVLLTGLALLFACGTPDQPEQKPEIKIPSESQAVFSSGIQFAQSAGSSKVTFTATDTWMADVTDTKASSWLSVKPTGGGAGDVNMTVTAQPNTGEATRSATVFIKCGTVSKSFTVTQAGTPPAPPSKIPVESVSLNKTELNLTKGKSEMLVATVLPENATDKTVTWSSSDATVASVGQDGKVTALKSGKASITAKAGEKSASCAVTVTTPVESVSLDRNNVTLEVGQTTTLVATIHPNDADEKTVEWTTSNAAVATVDNGKVTAVKEGTATITASVGGKSATCTVTVSSNVVPVASVTLNKTELSLEEGESETLTATVLPENATDKTVSWSSGDATIATVDQNGKVTAVKEGSTTVTAKAGEKSAICTVTVTKPAEPFFLTPTSVEMEAGGGTFTVTVTCGTTYHINSKPDWVTEESVSDKVHTFSVPANTSTEERSGVIVFCDDQGTCLPCTVKQAGKDVFEISPTEVSMGSGGGTFEIKVTATRGFHISSTPEWIKQKSLKDKVYTFEVEANPDTQERSGVVVICDDLGTCLPCTVKQSGASPIQSEGDSEDIGDGNPIKW